MKALWNAMGILRLLKISDFCIRFNVQDVILLHAELAGDKSQGTKITWMLRGLKLERQLI